MEQEHTEQSKIKVVKIDPLEATPDIIWRIAGQQPNALKDFVLYMDEKGNTLYVNKTKNIPQNDIDKFIWFIEAEDVLLDDDTDHGKFIDYVFKNYGEGAGVSLMRAWHENAKKRKQEFAENTAKHISPIIKKELGNTSVNDMVLYYIKGAGDENRIRTCHDMVNYGVVYCFMLGYLIGVGKIDAENIVSVDEEEEND